MKKFIALMLTWMALVGLAHAAGGGGAAWDKAPNRLNDNAALQNGAKLFANYCLNCHSAGYMRYNRLTDIGLTPKQIQANLNFITPKVGDLMKVTANPADSAQWFGAAPPDLSVIARSRAGAGGSGADYLYTFLRGFYRDPARPTGWNNHAFVNTAMPNVLWQMQASMNQADFDNSMGDLVAYLQWMGEPSQTTRKQVGVWVLLFLAGFVLIAWRLNAAYWRHIK
jgi:ubiquinol-cytochrome c reductase cytochrome c1 subunit